jgi:alkanesulfonate monooxygenase SsuD/methylene tetrahydromethanopterin reductase-like flavin-dependent oxidoreductase (luciferase family)
MRSVAVTAIGSDLRASARKYRRAEGGTRRVLTLGVRIAPRDASPGALAECIALAQRAEALGFGWIGVAERFDARGGVPDALSVCAAVAAATDRPRIATAALPLPLHHPLRVAEHAAMIDVLAGGRLELGVGLGAAETPFASFGLDADERSQRFAESLALLRAAWAAAPVTFRGEHFACENVAVYPKPLQQGGPPLWLAASAAAALRRAAQLGVGVMLPAEADAAPYFGACRDAGARARVALLAGAGATRDSLAGALVRCAGASEIVLAQDASSEAELARAASLGAELRSD